MNSRSFNLLLVGMCPLIFCVLQVQSSLFVSDVKMEKMIELNARKPHCRLHTDRGDIQSTVLHGDPLKIRQVPVETVAALENVCFEGNQLTGEIQGGLSFIYPGTLWCGPGNIAKNYSLLGRHEDEDRCCRAHDNCYPQMAPGECLKSICNHGSFTRLHCDCDEKFRNCLRALNTEIGNTLGAAFFNAIQVTCFDRTRPCSSLQRENCEWVNYPVRRFSFQPPNRNSWRMSENIVAQPRVAEEFDEGRSNQRQTFQLLFSAFYDNFIYRPLKTLGNFYIITKTIIYNPSAKVEQKYLIS